MDHYLEVRYEELSPTPRRRCGRVCEFLELPFDPAMVDPPERAEIEAELGPVGGWRERLDARAGRRPSRRSPARCSTSSATTRR